MFTSTTANTEVRLSEDQVIKKMARRLLPLLVLMFVIAFIDRQNVGFAKLDMMRRWASVKPPTVLVLRFSSSAI